MALTAVAPSRSTLNAAGFSSASLQIPRLLAAVAITGADALGVAITQVDTQGPACLVSLSAAADWFWSDTDGVATTSMRKVLAGDSYMVQCTPNKTQNFFAKTAAGTNLIVTLEG